MYQHMCVCVLARGEWITQQQLEMGAECVKEINSSIRSAISTWSALWYCCNCRRHSEGVSATALVTRSKVDKLWISYKAAPGHSPTLYPRCCANSSGFIRKASELNRRAFYGFTMCLQWNKCDLALWVQSYKWSGLFFCAVVHADGKRTKKGQNTLMFPNIIISLPPITVTSFSLDFPKTRGKHLAEFNIIIFFFHRNIFPSNLVSAAFQSVSAATRFYNFI